MHGSVVYIVKKRLSGSIVDATGAWTHEMQVRIFSVVHQANSAGYIVEPLTKGHLRTEGFVPYLEVVLYWEHGLLGQGLPIFLL